MELDSRVLLDLFDVSGWRVQPVVGAQVEEPNVIERLVASSADLFVDTAASAVDSPVLTSHDGLDASLGLDVSRESGNLGDRDEDLIPLEYVGNLDGGRDTP
jgi:hypothetical protein